MLFLAATLHEFLQFLKIVMWISIPLFLLSTLVVVFWHYRKKKMESVENGDEFALQLINDGSIIQNNRSSPSEQGFVARLTEGRNQYNELKTDLMEIKNNFNKVDSASEENQSDPDQNRPGLDKKIQQYELKIAQFQQAIDFLNTNAHKEEEYEKLKTGFAEKNRELIRLTSIAEQLNKEISLLTHQNDSKNNEIQKLDRLLKEMQESAKQASHDARNIQIAHQEQTEDKDKGHFEENTRLTAELKTLHESFKSLEEENHQLQQKIQERSAELIYDTKIQSNEHILILESNLTAAREEISSLKDQLENAEALEEILLEKKAEIDFLQQQLEQRIRVGKTTEQKLFAADQAIIDYKQKVDSLSQEIKFLAEESGLRKEEIDKQRLQLEDGSAENRLLKQELLEKNDRMVLLAKEHESFKLEMSNLETELSSNKEKERQLLNQLENARKNNTILEEQIQEKQKILALIHGQLTEVVNRSRYPGSGTGISAALPLVAEGASL